MTLLKMNVSVPLHYCSSSFKDGVQLRRRIMRRAKNVKRPHEVLTEDGTLLKGVIETDNVAATAAWILKEFDIPGRLIWSDRQAERQAGDRPVGPREDIEEDRPAQLHR